MEIKDQTMTTDIDSEGHEFVSELSETITDTRADGTEVVAEITTTADPDNPTEVEGHLTMTETASDGTETVTEITSSADGTITVEEDKSFSEEVFEAFFGESDDDDATELSDNETDESGEDDAVFAATDEDFIVSGETLDANILPIDSTEIPVTDAPFNSSFGVSDTTYSAGTIADSTADSSLESSDNAETLEQQAHVQAAEDAQQSADEFIASGDYAAAAEARETAENESWQAGDDSMLSAYDAQDLTNAAEKQEDANFYEAREAEHAQAGDYAAAREDASNAAYAVGDADSSAGGADHTGQADAEKYNMDNAVWQEGIADDAADNAVYYAEAGNYDAAEAAADSAAEHQGMADHYGDLGEHGGDMAVYDTTSEVETGGTYDSSFDSTAVDTGLDSSVDMSASSSYDSGTDDV